MGKPYLLSSLPHILSSSLLPWYTSLSLSIFLPSHSTLIFPIDDEEDLVSKLRAILAQLEFSYEIKQWDQKDVPFSTYFYIPEVHPETNQHFLEQEDEAHVFKVGLTL